MSKNEQLNPEKNTEERNENALRPLYLRDFLGQEKLKENLEIFIKAAKNRGDVLDHSLFYGPPGLGKTTLAQIIAHEMTWQRFLRIYKKAIFFSSTRFIV
jgi:Holliday junction DNA helicase RuvB